MVRQAGAVPASPVRRPRAVRASLTAAPATVLTAVLTAVLAVSLAGCVGLPPTIGPTGVDGLTVPTPSPQPEDFVGGVDHPLLPLVPGARWELADAVTGAELALEVVDAERTVAGVAATGLAATVTPGARSGATTSTTSTGWFAEDDEGNVWLLAGSGPDGGWEAGEQGAVAGLALAADSRVGDGYPLWTVDGTPAATAEVLATDEEVAVPTGLVEGVVTLALDLDLAREGPELEVALGEGVGPVLVEDVATGDDLVLTARS
jgi:hypothetical protein